MSVSYVNKFDSFAVVVCTFAIKRKFNLSNYEMFYVVWFGENCRNIHTL